MKTFVKLNYKSFLLRLWQAKGNDRQRQRASLQDVDGGEKRYFTSLQDLLVYLYKTSMITEETSGEGMDQGCRVEGADLHPLTGAQEYERRVDCQREENITADARIVAHAGCDTPRNI